MHPFRIPLRRFMRVRIVAYYLHHILPSVLLSACISQAPSGRISAKFNIGIFTHICRETPTLGKNREKYRALHMKTPVRFIVAASSEMVQGYQGSRGGTNIKPTRHVHYHLVSSCEQRAVKYAKTLQFQIFTYSPLITISLFHRVGNISSLNEVFH